MKPRLSRTLKLKYFPWLEMFQSHYRFIRKYRITEERIDYGTNTASIKFESRKK